MDSNVDDYVTFLERSAHWYRWHANKAMILFISLRLVLTVLSAALPALAAKVAGLDLTIPAILIAVLTALDTQFKWGDEWRQYRTTQLSLERMVRMFQQGAFAPKLSEPQRFQRLVEEAETLMARDAESFFRFRIKAWSNGEAPQ
ncbi:MAG: DUF4231 domain-containing protein [Porphyrobacter sp.]|nr:DUF4231 domain-containing protein [Porphyrobacter sp.]